MNQGQRRGRSSDAWADQWAPDDGDAAYQDPWDPCDPWDP